MLDFRRIALFCLEKRLSKHKMTIFSKNLGGAWPLCPHLAMPMAGVKKFRYLELEPEANLSPYLCSTYYSAARAGPSRCGAQCKTKTFKT